MDVIGEAMKIFQQTKKDTSLEVSVNGVVDENLFVSYFFRNSGAMGSVEQYAIEHSTGKVLDVGAGAGCHSMELLKREVDVTPIDVSVLSVEVMKNRGLEQAKVADIMTLQEKYDTILLLMNGLGIGYTLSGTRILLEHLKTLLADGGQIFGDSTNIAYMFKRDEIESKEKYFGEVSFGVKAEGIGSQEFAWIFIDANALADLCDEVGLNCEIIGSEDGFHYLARLTSM